MIVVLLFAGVPMALFFGVGNPFDTSQRGPDMERVVIEVYDQPVSAATFMNQYAALTDQLRASGQPVPTATELVLNETVDQMIESLTEDALLMYEVRNRPYRPDQAYLEERLKEFAIFRDAEGNFNSAYFNQWVTAQQNAGMNWNEIWDMVAEQAKRELYLALVSASARVLDSELREEFEHENTRIKVRYLHVEPPVEVSDAAIEEYYNEHQDAYYTDPRVEAVVVPFSTRSEEPPIVREILEQARGGADFAELAEEHSAASSRVDGGSIGWLANRDTLPEFRRKLFELEPGEVSGPIEGPLGLYIYKVEEKRTDEASGMEEVLAREIVVPANLDPEQQAAIEARAEDLIAAATESSLSEAAAAAGLPVIELGPFDRSTLELEGIPPMDAARLRMTLTQEGIGVVEEPIPAANNLYVAEITQVLPRERQPLEQVREDVVRDWTQEYKASPEYTQRLGKYLAELQTSLSEYQSLGALRQDHPELTTEPKTTRLFGRSDMLFDEGWFVDSSTVHTLLEGKEEGALAGPVRDFRNEYYLVELVERQEPTEEMWETQWPQEREELRDRALAGLSNERIQDHIAHRLEQAFAAGQVRSDTDTMFALLGVQPGAAMEAESPVVTQDSPLPTGEPEMTPPLAAPETEPEQAPAEQPAPENGVE